MKNLLLWKPTSEKQSLVVTGMIRMTDINQTLQGVDDSEREDENSLLECKNFVPDRQACPSGKGVSESVRIIGQGRGS